MNTLSPGDKVVNVCVGVFGERFGDIAEVFGAEVISLDFPYGSAADPDKIRETLNENPDVKAVLVTHNETSTGGRERPSGDCRGGEGGVRQAAAG